MRCAEPIALSALALDRFVTVGTLRCSAGPSTPALFRFHVGERVTMVCDAGAVVRMRH